MRGQPSAAHGARSYQCTDSADTTVVDVELGIRGVFGAFGVGSWEVWLGRRAYDLPAIMHDPLVLAMQVGTRGMVIVAALVVGRWWGHRSGLTVFVAGAGAWVVAAALKLLELRDRPTSGALGRNVRETVDGAGFPSTHSAIAVSLAVVIALDRRCPPWLAALAGALAVATMAARLHLGVHWFLDVVGGAAVGAISATIARRAISSDRGAT